MRMEKKCLIFNQCAGGKVIQYDSSCPHWRNGQCIELRRMCKDEEAVSDFTSEPI